MDKQRIEIYKQFAKYLDYPMVVFEAESGKILEISHEAEMILGKSIKSIHIEPGRSLVKVNFWELLHEKKSFMWHRIVMTADEKEYLVCGLVNEMTVEGKPIYALLFELRSGIRMGSLTLERIVNHAGMVAVHISKEEDNLRIEYVTENISRYGYARAQIYRREVLPQDLFSTEDWEQVRKHIMNATRKHMNEDVIECRIVTADRELIPIRVLIYYLYEGDTMTDLEFLIIDLREEIKRDSENAYLRNAVFKMKSVVLVRSFRDGKRILKYISPNAGILGINVDALRKGYKLMEDYIHPEDREIGIDTVYQAIANEIGHFSHTARLVRDDGKLIWVELDITISRVSDGEAEVAFLMTDVTEQKKMEEELAETAVSEEEPAGMAAGNSSSLVKGDKTDSDMLAQLQMMAENLSQDADYYSVVLDADGRVLTTPIGPMNSIGQFYDLFERPQVKERFGEISVRAKEEFLPQSVSFAIGGIEVHMVFAPLMPEDTVTAYWVLTSFAKDGQEIIDEAVTKQWNFANSIVKCFCAEEAVQSETKLRKLAQMQFDKEQKKLHMIEDMVTSMLKQGQGALGELCHKAGMQLSVSRIGLYLENKDTKNTEKYFAWDRFGDETSFFEDMELSVSAYQKLKEYFREKQFVVIDRSTNDLFLREMFQKSGVEAMIILALVSSSGMQGYVVFADTVRPHEFDEKDIRFAECVTHMFENIVFSNEKSVKVDVVKEGFFEAYDHIQDAVFVKDNRSGDIIFANKAMDSLYGYSLVGMPARDVVFDQLEQYQNMQGMRKRFIGNKKVKKWQSYMKELDQIMNIVEIHMETLTGKDYSLFILKKNS